MSEWLGEASFSLAGESRDPGNGVRCLLSGPFQSEVEIQLYQTAGRLWTWRWTEVWLGHTTVSAPRMSWLSRDHALDSLRRVAVLYRVPPLADHMLTWR